MECCRLVDAAQNARHGRAPLPPKAGGWRPAGPSPTAGAFEARESSCSPHGSEDSGGLPVAGYEWVALNPGAYYRYWAFYVP